MTPDSITSAAIRRTDQKHLEQLAESHPLDSCVAYFSTRHPRVPGCNGVFDVDATQLTSDAQSAIARVFRDRGTTCGFWRSRQPEPDSALAARLAPLGFRAVYRRILRQLPRTHPPSVTLRVLSARAMRRTYQSLLEVAFATASGGRNPALAEAEVAAHLDRLDDPNYDVLIALDGDAPLAAAALLQVGEIGRVCDWVSAPPTVDASPLPLLLARISTAARRWALQMIWAVADEADEPGYAALLAAGFEPAGDWIEFRGPHENESGPHQTTPCAC